MGSSDWQARCAAWKTAELGSRSEPPPPFPDWIRMPPPPALLVGSGKSFTPCERMHAENANMLLNWSSDAAFAVVLVAEPLPSDATPGLAETVATGLRREGMAVDLAFDGDQALERGAVHDYDVIVLDRDLPRVHGDDVCRALVASGGRARVLMLTAAATIEDRVDGLGIGADDYLPKPFAFAELIARVRALARRAQPAVPPVLTRGDIWLDPGKRVASRAGRRLDLSPKELAVLELLLDA